MKQSFVLPFRQIHLDFHTGPAIRDVGVDFDAREFARTMKAAHVNSVTVFAKCHHGHLYYDTNRPERHPGLKRDLNLLGEQVEALHREGIRAPIYISIQCDEYAANTRPEWVARTADGKQVGINPPVPGIYPNFNWQILDMSTPYQDYLAEQTEEILRLFKPVDGIFFDMCWDQPSTNKHFVRAMQKDNLNPELEADRAEYGRRLALQYMKRFHRMVRDASPNASVFFNSRPLARLHQDIPYQEQVEIEALPTGGWGYMYFPKNVRFARTFGKPYMGMTARFHKSWADFGGLKPPAALEYETSQMLAHGAKVSIGDQLHPRGTLDRGAYELIGAAYKRVIDREQYVEGAEAVVDIGLFQAPSSAQMGGQGISGVDEGATRLLSHIKAQFNVVGPASDWRPYKLLILPDQVEVDAALAKKLSAYVKAGGALLCTGTSGLSADGTQVVLPELGVKPAGLSPFSVTYLRFGKEVGQGVPPSDHVMYERGVRVTPAAGTQVVCKIVEPYFERTWEHFSSHAQTPGDKASKFAAATVNGKVAYVAFPMFSAYGNHGNYPYRLLVRNLIDRLLPDPVLRVQAPTSTEATVARQADPKRTIVHLLQYAPERRAGQLDIVEDVVPLHDVPVSLNLAKKPARVYLAPEGTDVEFTFRDGRANVIVPRVNGHAMVVFE
ncbi:MAG TPA: beta-galactosidase trimerization domain-containing protein [Tepidisphaeraceae bacterium]|nr:beta-galactosidase trimerization domain-containing protein [Tepidisphaeraceae bacterium]